MTPPYSLKVHSSLPSTNDFLKELAAKNAPEWSAILANKQTKGRGRRTNSWKSSPGGLYLSILLYPKSVERIQLLTFGAALSVLHAIKDNYGSLVHNLSIKWPNDLLINGKKTCGILTETVFGERTSTIVGIGLNLNQKEFSSEIKDIATSLLIETKQKKDTEQMARSIISHLQHYYSLFEKKQHQKILDEWKKNCATLGKEVRIISTKETFTGKAIGVTADGMLRIKTSSGKIRTVLEGEVSVRLK